MRVRHLMTPGLLGILVATGLLTTACGRHHGSPHRRPPEAGRMQAMDRDGDERITLEEWQSAHQERFTQLDRDRDGAITQAELDEARAKRQGRCCR